MFSVGDRVDRYVIEDLLGEGGAARVWQVRHHLLGSPHALKVLRSSSPEVQQRLLREGRAQAALRHPCILPVLDAFWAQGRVALLMPLVEGPSLRAVLRHGPVPVEEGLALTRALLSGLATVHAHGLVHCDLKPENILLDLRDGQLQPRILDFGLAHAAGSSRGTPAYIAPEQRTGSAGPTADLFSLGAVLYELLTGVPAFLTHTLDEVSARELPSLAPLPAPLRGTVRAMLSPAPELRPPSCAAVLAALPDAAPLSPSGVLWHRAAALLRPVSGGVVPAPVPDRAAEVPHNLPTSLPPLIGRAAALAKGAALLGGPERLLSVTGLGGVGKTRLALQLAADQRPAHVGGVWWVSLEGATTAGELRARVADVLEIETPDIGAALAARGPVLLVLDGAAGVVSACRVLLPAWLAAAPWLRVLVTSRVPLGAPGARRLPLGPLSPADAATLFCDRAAAVGAPVPDSERDAVDALVSALDGLPLAIVHAAARAPLLPPGGLLRRLEVEPSALSGGAESLAAVFSWSWRQLSPPAQRALVQLSAMRGAFSLELAESVLSGLAPARIDDVLQELLSMGLLVRHPEQRLALLQVVQRPAATRLSADARAAVMARLCAACLRWPGEARARERQHLAHAARWSMIHGDAGVAGWLVCHAHQAALAAGQRAEAAALLVDFSARPRVVPPRLSAHLALAQACSARLAGRFDAASASIRAAEKEFQAAQDTAGCRRAALQRAHLLRARGWYAASQDAIAAVLAQHGDAVSPVVWIAQADTLRLLGRYTAARASLAAALPADRPPGLTWVRACSAVDSDEGHPARATARLKAALAQERGPRAEVVLAWLELAALAIRTGALDEAERLLAQVRSHQARLGDQLQASQILAIDARMHQARGRLEPAVDALRGCLSRVERFGNTALLAWHRSELAQILGRLGRTAEARRLAAEALRQAQAHPNAQTPIVAARAALLHTQAGDLPAAAAVLAVPWAPASPLAALALQAARAGLAVAQASPEADALVDALEDSRDSLGLSPHCLLGSLGSAQRLLQRAPVTTYIDTLPRLTADR